MIRGALIEDDERTRSYLETRLVDEFRMRNELLWLSSYSCAEDFLRTSFEQEPTDVFFLDIEMPGTDGITLARRIRETAPVALVVFISARDSLVFETFSVQPFRFVRKHELDRVLPELADGLIKALRSRQGQLICLEEATTQDLYTFAADELLYVEARRKQCLAHARTTDVLLKASLTSLKEQLAPWGFIQCHRSYLVNWRTITRITKTEVRLSDGTSVPVSRSLRDEVRSQFLHHIETEVG